MESFPADFKESQSQRKRLEADERQNIYSKVQHKQEFHITVCVKTLMRELHVRFPHSFQMYKQLTSGLDNQPTGRYSWVTVDGAELADDFFIPPGTKFRILDYIPSE